MSCLSRASTFEVGKSQISETRYTGHQDSHPVGLVALNWSTSYTLHQPTPHITAPVDEISESAEIHEIKDLPPLPDFTLTTMLLRTILILKNNDGSDASFHGFAENAVVAPDCQFKFDELEFDQIDSMTADRLGYLLYRGSIKAERQAVMAPVVHVLHLQVDRSK